MLHQYAFFLSLAAGAALVAAASSPREVVGAAIFASTVATMFGASALYNRVTWSPKWRPRLRRLDHSMIFLLIAGSYTPFGLLVLSGAWQVAVLAIVWSGVGVAIGLKLIWINAPKWVAAGIGIGIGWVGIAAVPPLLRGVGVAGLLLVLAGGLFYTAGAIVYARRRPDPLPAVFGYHEIFHTLVIAAVACQYAAVAFFVL